jgi:hypothetical protein
LIILGGPTLFADYVALGGPGPEVLVELLGGPADQDEGETPGAEIEPKTSEDGGKNFCSSRISGRAPDVHVSRATRLY